MPDAKSETDATALWKMVARTPLRLRIVTILLTVSLLPLLLVGIGSWVVFGRLLEQRSLEQQQTVVDSHARAIDSYLSEHKNALRLLTDTHRLSDLANPEILSRYFARLNRSIGGGFVDLGVIGANGDHLAYVGPYDLLGINYADSDWFIETISEGEHISDVFLGFRNVPHNIIAVRSLNGEEPWILRATINSEQFDAIVRTSIQGASGDAYLTNRDGLFQTKPRRGDLLKASPIRSPSYFEGLRSERLVIEGIEVIRVTRWINQEKWLLVVQQSASEVRAPVNRAIVLGALNVLLAVAVTVLTTFLATRHLTNRIDKANQEREEMLRAFLRSAKLASVGELATGLAHEINNPLAIISADQTNIGDLAAMLDPNQETTKEILESIERTKRQIQRCKSITTKILQFGRSTETELKPVQIGRSLAEITKLLERQVLLSNVEMRLQIEGDLPPVSINELELEQIIVNLVNNSLFAMSNGGRIDIVARQDGKEVIVEVIDSGSGIQPQDLERIFEPFFTTKPLGKGTGLGLSVCYGVVQSWGGHIEAESTLGRGTTMRIRIPVTVDKKPALSHEVNHERRI